MNDEERLLLLEDDPRLAELVRHVLADSAPEFNVEHVGRLSTALARLVRQRFSLIVTDLDLPDSHGPATVRHLQRAAPNLPLVVLSGQGDRNVAQECIRDGADEFLVKGTPGFQALGQLTRLALKRRNERRDEQPRTRHQPAVRPRLRPKPWRAIMDLKNLSLGERIMSLASVLLLFDLLFLPWHRIDLGIVSVSRSGIQSPNGFLGMLAALVAVAIVVRVIISEFTSIELPHLPVSWERADLFAAGAVAGLLVLKFVLETSLLSIGAWLAIPLAGALLYGGYQRSRETPALHPDSSATSV